jgi:hypothetical protein
MDRRERVCLLHRLATSHGEPCDGVDRSLNSELRKELMTTGVLTRSLRMGAMAALFATSSVPSLSAEPIIVTSGQFQVGPGAFRTDRACGR